MRKFKKGNGQYLLPSLFFTKGEKMKSTAIQLALFEELVIEYAELQKKEKLWRRKKLKK